jgi:hypothetical protein
MLLDQIRMESIVPGRHRRVRRKDRRVGDVSLRILKTYPVFFHAQSNGL